MSALSLAAPMPKYLRKAVKLGVISPQEAERWHLHVLMREHQPVIVLPDSLMSAADRVHLWEAPHRGPMQ